MSNKHIRWDADETVERITADFGRGIRELDDLEQDIRAEFDGLEALALTDRGRVVS